MYRSPLSIKLMVFALLLATPVQFSAAATATELQQELQRKQQELDASKSAAQNKAAEANKLSSQIDNLTNDISSTEKKIEETGKEIDQTSGQIDALNKDIETKINELKALKQKLNKAIVEIYRFSSRSSIDLLLGSGSLGLNTNASNYVSSVEIQVKSVHAQVTSAKLDLERQKAQLEQKEKELNDLKGRQVSYKQGIEHQKTQKDKLLGLTIDEKEKYEALAKKLQSEISVISAEIYRLRQTRKGRGTVSGGGSGYNYSCGNVDPWSFYTCQCTSYAAWYWNVKLGKDWENTRPGTGSAYNWDNLARDQGYTVSSTPQVGAIVSWERGLYPGDQWGHVAIVEKVNSDGTIDVSEYNFAFREAFSYRSNINPADEGVGYSYIY